MGLLDKLWDDTVAGPRPDTGLSRLRKYSSLNTRPGPLTIKEDVMDSGMGKPEGEEAPRVTRSIMIKKPAGCPSPANSPRGNGTPPQSPAGSTPPLSPFYGGSGRFRRKSLSDAYERASTSVPKPDPPFEV
ncbi:dormancy/auxin associated family protein [Carex rostrata]